jgi:hypothetical protein
MTFSILCLARLFKYEELAINGTILWDITPYSPLRINRRFGGTSPLSSGSKNKLSKKPGACHLLSRWFLTQLIFRP